MIKNFENFSKVQHFSNGFTQWSDGDLAQSAKVLIDDVRITRSLVRSAFKAKPDEFGNIFSREDASRIGLVY